MDANDNWPSRRDIERAIDSILTEVTDQNGLDYVLSRRELRAVEWRINDWFAAFTEPAPLEDPSPRPEQVYSPEDLCGPKPW